MLVFTKQQARDIVWDESEEYEVVRTEDHGSSRWSAHKECIFAPRGQKETGPWYKLDYSVGLTEYQDERPFEYEDEVTANEVFPHAVQTIVFKTTPVTIQGN